MRTTSASRHASITVNGTAAALDADGSHTLTITGTNGAGATTILPILTSDTTPPGITAAITPGPNAAGWNKSAATVTFTCSDATSGVALCPPPVVVSTETASQTVSGSAIDNAGNHAAASAIVKLDKTAPAIAITSPASGATTTTSLIVSGTVSDALSAATVTCNAGAATVSGGTFSCVVALVSGDNVITAAATDTAGNSSAATIHATYNADAQAPVVAITSPINGAVAKVPTVNVTGTASDDVAVASVTVNGTNATLANGTWSATIALTAGDGAKVITATASDATNKQTSASVQITLDTTAPVVTVTAPASNAVVAAASLAISGTVVDALTGIAAVTCNGAPATQASGTFTCNVALLEGDNAISIVATDNAGNSSTAILPVALDTRAPALTITSPDPNACLAALTFNVSGKTYDPHAAGVNVSIAPRAPVAATVSADGTWTAALIAPEEGRYTIVAEAADSGGHVVTTTLPVIVDTTAPVVQVTDGGSIVNHPTSIAFRAIDADASAVTTATLNGQPYVSGAAIVADGDYTFSVSARDCAGNTSTVRTIPFTIDTVAPSIGAMTPADGANVGSASITISGALSADDVASVVISGTPYSAAISGRTFTFAGVSLADGANQLTIKATDRAGNSSTKIYTLNVKSTSPVVDILESGAPIPAGALFNRPIAPLVRATGSAAIVTATLNTNPFTSGTTIPSDGAYTLRATASHAFGHTSAEATPRSRSTPLPRSSIEIDQRRNTSDKTLISNTPTELR